MKTRSLFSFCIMSRRARICRVVATYLKSGQGRFMVLQFIYPAKEPASLDITLLLVSRSKWPVPIQQKTMPFNPPSSVPKITYASYSPQNPQYYPPGHSTDDHPPPTQRDVHTNHKLNQHFVSVKAALLTMLRTRHLPNLPPAFPFRFVRVAPGRVASDSGTDRPQLSYSSYEFLEYVVVDPMSPPCCAVFSYTAPSHCYDPAAKNGASLSKMTWQIKIPSLDSMAPNEPRTCTFDPLSFRKHTEYLFIQTVFTVSQVEIDPELIETPFGYEFMTDKHMLLEALSISLEQGIHLTVQLAVVTTEKRRDIYKSRNRGGGLHYRSGDLVFVAKRNDGRREVVHVYDPFEPFARKSWGLSDRCGLFFYSIFIWNWIYRL